MLVQLELLYCVRSFSVKDTSLTQWLQRSHYFLQKRSAGQITVWYLVLVECYDNEMVKSPYNCVIYLLTQPQVANQQKKTLSKLGYNNIYETI